jgi:hypothetical protein
MLLVDHARVMDTAGPILEQEASLSLGSIRRISQNRMNVSLVRCMHVLKEFCDRPITLCEVEYVMASFAS